MATYLIIISGSVKLLDEYKNKDLLCRLIILPASIIPSLKEDYSLHIAGAASRN